MLPGAGLAVETVSVNLLVHGHGALLKREAGRSLWIVCNNCSPEKS